MYASPGRISGPRSRMIVSTERSMEPRCTGRCGALATRAPVAIEHGAGEIEPLLDVHRLRGVAQRFAHLLGDGHEQVVEHLEQHGVGGGAEALALAWFGARQNDVVDAVSVSFQPGSTTTVWCGSMTSAGPATALRRARAPRACTTGASCQLPRE